MKKLNKTEGIAIFIALAVVGSLLYGNTILGYINGGNQSSNATTTNLTQQTMNLETGIKTEDEINGTGQVAVAGDQVTVHYVGTLTDGRVFDSSLDRGQPFTFTLGAGQVIKGWDEGVAGMREGGKRKLIIAPDFGYGSQAVGPIPPNSTLVFEVELLKVNHAATAPAQ